MIVCSCNVLSDGQIRACVNPGPGCPRTASDVYECLGCSPKCGRCARTIRAIVASALGAASEAIAGCTTDCAAVCPLGKAVHANGDHGHAHADHAHAAHAHGHRDHGNSHLAERFLDAVPSVSG